MMKNPPVIAFSGYKHTGKTTLIARLVEVYAERGLRVGCIKHDGHDFPGQSESTDSGKYLLAGAQASVVSSKTGHVLLEVRKKEEHRLEELIAMAGSVDLIFIEGFKEMPIPKWVLLSEKESKFLYKVPEFVKDPMVSSHVVGYIVPDDTLTVADMHMPVYHRDNILGIVSFMDQMWWS